MNEKMHHNCELLDSDTHSLSVQELKISNGEMQWFLINNKTNTAECILYCPYCGKELAEK